jgi:hypothetical protein
MNLQKNHHWLDGYTSGNGNQCFKRPLGLVETSFDSDGTYYGGRADMTATLKLEIRHTLGKTQLRERIANAWTLLRLQHVLLMSRVEDDAKSGKRCFVVDVPTSAEEAVQQVEKNMVWLEDFGLEDTGLASSCSQRWPHYSTKGMSFQTPHSTTQISSQRDLGASFPHHHGSSDFRRPLGLQLVQALDQDSQHVCTDNQARDRYIDPTRSHESKATTSTRRPLSESWW